MIGTAADDGPLLVRLYSVFRAAMSVLPTESLSLFLMGAEFPYPERSGAKIGAFGGRRGINCFALEQQNIVNVWDAIHGAT
jgi:hypothetical protein